MPVSARRCIVDLAADGRIDRQQATRFLTLFDELETGYRSTFGEAAAAAMASSETVARLAAEAAEGRRTKLLQIGQQRAIATGLKAHVDKGGRADQYAISLFDHHEAVPGVSNIDNRRGAIERLAWTKMDDFLGRYRRTLTGVMRNAAEGDNVVRELFGRETGDVSAAETARAFHETAEWLRFQFNAAGGHIAKLEDWGLPQAHDAMAVARAGFGPWRDFILPLLDRDRMLDQVTNRPFTDEGLEVALRGVFNAIESEGLSRSAPGTIVGSKLANSRTDHRFLQFAEPDGWLAYQARFGAGDPMNAMAGHIGGMARDIAAMQVLGPNPALTVRWLTDVLKRDAPIARPGMKGILARTSSFEVERMWRHYTGSLNRPVIPQVARFFDGIRNWNVASKLGSAPLAALTDTVYQGATAKFNGLSSTRIMRNYLEQLNPADPTHREAARRMGMTGSQVVTNVERMRREGTMIPVNMRELSSRTANASMSLSGLSAWTNAGEQAVGLEFMESMADRVGSSFERLDEPFQLALERYGIGAEGWEIVRATPLSEQHGRRFLRPDELTERPDLNPRRAYELGIRLLEMIESESKFAVPKAGLRASTALSLVPRGTGVGDLLHSMTQFKTFSVGALYTHTSRMIWGRGGVSRIGYTLGLSIGLTMMGGLISQLYEVANGRDLLPMDDDAFWKKAATRGGAQPILGDLLLSDQSRTGGGVAGYVTGPTIASVIDPALRLTKGIGGEKSNTGRELVKFLRDNTPGGSTWYARLAVQRLMFDQLQEMADPNYRKSWRRMEKRIDKQGQDYFWRPGELAPERAPDWSNALGEMAE